MEKKLKASVIHYNQNLDNRKLQDKTAVVIDLFRATSVIVTAIAQGAKAVIPVCDISSANSAAEKLGRENCILAGERNRELIEGFDYGNSPQDFTHQRIKDKTLVLTTTNGTRAIEFAREASEIYIASLLNLSYCAEQLATLSNDLIIVCSGSQGEFSLEDGYCAGALLEALSVHADLQLDDMACALHSLYTSYQSDSSKLLHQGRAYAALSQQGYQQDIHFCLQQDRYAILPQYQAGQIQSHQQLNTIAAEKTHA
jgi:2-phosphosulfolactate phosphatase